MELMELMVIAVYQDKEEETGLLMKEYISMNMYYLFLGKI
jgi:hypothetical protein